MNKISLEHMQFLVDTAMNDLFEKQKEHHGWTIAEYSLAVQQQIIEASQVSQNQFYLN